MPCFGNDVNHIWDRIRSRIGIHIRGENFERFFGPLSPIEVTEDHLHLGIADAFLRDWISDHYGDVIRDCAALELGRPVQVTVKVIAVPAPAPLPPSAPPEATLAAIDAPVVTAGEVSGVQLTRSFPLNPAYTFDTFVVGGSNEMAFAACESVAKSPSRNYNPLYIYGGTGLGKTHLLHAIAHKIRANDPSLRITYVSAEEFTNQVVSSLRNGAPATQMHAFRDLYRAQSDVLLVDDVHVLGGKERTQEEFFHTFNALHQARKQVILTSDCSPAEISGLTERLRSRFNWGMIADISTPDLETRVAILERMASREGFELDQDIAFQIAQRIRTNVRELEGALSRTVAYANLRGRNLTRELVSEVLSRLASDTERGPTLESIVHAVAQHFDLNVDDLRGTRRQQQITQPRSIAMYLCRRITQASYPAIGSALGGKDHTTVIYACKKIAVALEHDAAMQTLMRTLERRITG